MVPDPEARWLRRAGAWPLPQSPDVAEAQGARRDGTKMRHVGDTRDIPHLQRQSMRARPAPEPDACGGALRLSPPVVEATGDAASDDTCLVRLVRFRAQNQKGALDDDHLARASRAPLQGATGFTSPTSGFPSLVVSLSMKHQSDNRGHATLWMRVPPGDSRRLADPAGVACKSCRSAALARQWPADLSAHTSDLDQYTASNSS